MSDKRVTVWVQHFTDRDNLVLQWIDPDTNKRKSQSAKTADPEAAEKARADLEYELNHGMHQERSRMAWDRFRELFEEEYVSALRLETQKVYDNALNLFEKVCNPQSIRAINERTISAFAAGLRKQPGNGGKTMAASTIKVRLQFLHTALMWAAEQGLLPKCPKFPVIKVPFKAPQPVPAESFEKLLLKATDPEMEAFLLCGWLAGLRLSEVWKLEREETQEAPWVDFARNRIWLPAEFVKAVKDQWLPLDPALRVVLEALPGHGRKFFRFVAKDGHPIRQSALTLRIVTLAKKAGVKLTMKSLRRGFGCRYAGKVSAHVLQRLMRHSNIAITMNYYANIDDAVEEAVLGKKSDETRLCNDSRNSSAQDTQEHDQDTGITPSTDDANADESF